MKIYKSIHYDAFRCIAQDCPDSCCKEWDVLVDDVSADLYRSLPGALGDRLRQVMYTEDGKVYLSIEDGRCPMWRKDGLCRIQADLGHDALCKTCRDFPRLTHDYGDFMELGLELSCPEAARMILSSPDFGFTAEEIPGGEEPDYDREAMEVLLKTRENAFTILGDTRYSVPEALALLLIYGYRAQELLDGGNAANFDPLLSLRQAHEMATPAHISEMLQFFSSLEILTAEWKRRLGNPSPSPWNEQFRNLARYGIERYWLQAVSDYDLVSRVKLIVIFCLVVQALGGDFIATAQLFSKEIENDADNVDAILDGAYASHALTDDKILGLLFSNG